MLLVVSSPASPDHHLFDISLNGKFVVIQESHNIVYKINDTSNSSWMVVVGDCNGDRPAVAVESGSETRFASDDTSQK